MLNNQPYSVDLLRYLQEQGFYLKDKFSLVLNIARSNGDEIPANEIRHPEFLVQDADYMVVFLYNKTGDGTLKIYINGNYEKQHYFGADEVYPFVFNLQTQYSHLKNQRIAITFNSSVQKIGSMGILFLNDYSDPTPNNGDTVVPLHLNKFLGNYNSIWLKNKFQAGWLGRKNEVVIGATNQFIHNFTSGQNTKDGSSTKSHYNLKHLFTDLDGSVGHSILIEAKIGAEIEIADLYVTGNGTSFDAVVEHPNFENYMDDQVGSIYASDGADRNSCFRSELITTRQEYQASQVLSPFNINTTDINQVFDLIDDFRDNYPATILSLMKNKITATTTTATLLTGAIFTKGKSATTKNQIKIGAEIIAENFTAGEYLYLETTINSVTKTLKFPLAGTGTVLLKSDLQKFNVIEDYSKISITCRTSVGSCDIYTVNIIEY